MRKTSNLLSVYLLALTTVFTLTFCTTDNSADQQDVTISSALDDNENAFYRLTENDSIRIAVSVAEESRCPVGAMCPWEGFVKVTFNVSSVDHPVDLYKYESGHQNVKHPDRYLFSVRGKEYKLILNNVTPYPTTENQNSPKSVEFTLARQ